MTWGFPAAFWLAAVAIPIVALFLYRRRSKVVEVPAVDIWMKLGHPVNVSSMSSLLRRLPALLVQLLLAMLLVTAVADPSPPPVRVARLVLVLDTSATMQTHEGGETRIEIARREARRIVERAGPETEIVVLRAAQGPVLATAATLNKEAALRAVQESESLDIEIDLQLSVRASRSFLDPRGSTDVIVLSDFAGSDPNLLRQSWQPPARLQLMPVGASHPNAAITGLWSGQEGVDRRVVATIAQRGLSGREVPVYLSVDGQRVATQNISLADEPVNASFVVPVAAGSSYEVNVDAGDALPLDDRAFGVVPFQEGLSICLVTAGNTALENALSADPTVRLSIVKRGEFTGASAETVVVVDGPVLSNRDPGNVRGYLFLNTADPFGWSRVTATTVVPPVTHWDGAHPALADADPTLFRLNQAMTMEWSQGCAPLELVGADRWTVMAELKHAAPGGQPVRCIYWLFDLKNTDLTRRLSFPLLIWNAVEYLATGGHPVRPDWRPIGQSLELKTNDASTETASPVVLDPSGRALSSRRTTSAWTVSDTFRQGLYRWQNGGEQFAVNLLSARGTLPLPELREAQPDQSQLQHDDPVPSWIDRLLRRISWRSLLIASIIVGLVEWVLFNRRWLRIG